jgi:cytochrome c biogenesis factor
MISLKMIKLAYRFGFGVPLCLSVTVLMLLSDMVVRQKETLFVEAVIIYSIVCFACSFIASLIAICVVLPGRWKERRTFDLVHGLIVSAFTSFSFCVVTWKFLADRYVPATLIGSMLLFLVSLSLLLRQERSPAWNADNETPQI